MMKLFTRAAQVVIAAVLMVGCALAQQAYPNKPIRIIVAFPPGGGIDIVARLVGQKLAESWGQQVLVENRPGGSTVIGTEALLKSAPDGHTLLAMSSSHVTNPHLIPKLPYDAIKDFAPVTTLINTAFVLAINPSVPANNLREFIALAKSKPGQLNYSSAGNASAPHLAGELLNITAGIKLQHVPYKGGVPAVNDLLGGLVQLTIQPPIFVLSHVKAGKLKALAISGNARFSALPDVPTFAEAGLPGYDMNAWFGLLAPAGTPKAVIDKLSAEIARILVLPDIKEKLLGQGLEPFISTPEQLAALMKSDLVKYGKLIRAANIKLDD